MLRPKASDLPLTVPSCRVCAGCGACGNASDFGDEVAIPETAGFTFLTLSIEFLNYGDGSSLTLSTKKAAEPAATEEKSMNPGAIEPLQIVPKVHPPA